MEAKYIKNICLSALLTAGAQIGSAQEIVKAENSISSGNTEEFSPKEVIISPTRVLSKDSLTQRESVYEWSVQALKIPAREVKSHPSSVYFPGKVEEGATFTSRTLKLSHKPIAEELVEVVRTLRYSSPLRNTLYSTGMYAAPGKVVTVEIPDELRGKLQVQIGIHTDNLNQWVAGKQDWRRMPLIWNKVALDETITEIANPFGGLIYISCSPLEEAWEAEVIVNNAIEAPYFKLGETTQLEWKQMQQSSAPWGEMASENIIVTIPTTALRQVKDPTENMQLWDRIIGEIMDLAQLPLPFYRAQRLVTDVHIGGGYMHSGYPIMISHSPEHNLVSEDIMIAPENLTKPSGGGANWGFFHEIGHNMQNLDWVFDGTTEVTVNLFSLYVFDKVIGSRDGAHTGISEETTRDLMQKYFDGEGPSLEKWKSNPFLALILFRQLQEEFGWELFKTTFRKYHSFTDEQRPKGDQAKRDTLITFLSESAQRDFTGFFEAWGLPVSEATKKKLNHYEAWMPEDFPPVG